jgi:hypothetical protein
VSCEKIADIRNERMTARSAKGNHRNNRRSDSLLFRANSSADLGNIQTATDPKNSGTNHGMSFPSMTQPRILAL